MEDLLHRAGWAPVASLSDEPFELIKKQKALYSRVESEEAWKDFMFRLTQMRDGTRIAIERGVVDQHGRTHEPEQRAVLYVLEQLLTYVPGINRDYEQMIKMLQADEAVANAPVYGGDQMTALTTDVW